MCRNLAPASARPASARAAASFGFESGGAARSDESGVAACARSGGDGTEQSAAAASSHCGNDENGVLQCSDLTDAQFNIALGSPAWNNRNRGGAGIAPGADGAGSSQLEMRRAPAVALPRPVS